MGTDRLRGGRAISTIAWAVLLGLWPGTVLLSQTADGFNPILNGRVYALAEQLDGKLVAAGDFTTFIGSGELWSGRASTSSCEPSARRSHARAPELFPPLGKPKVSEANLVMASLIVRVFADMRDWDCLEVVGCSVVYRSAHE